MLIHLLHLHTYTSGLGLVLVAVAGVGVLATRGGRPLVKSAIKGYLTASEAVRGWAAEAAEEAQDLYAESKAEVAATTAAAGTGSAD